VPPPPLECGEVRGVATCLEGFLIPPDEPFTLPVLFPGCGCCPETECVTSVDVAAREVHLTTGVCPDPCDCDGCWPIVGGCDVPPLSLGVWTVLANGVEAFELPVEHDSGVVPPPNMCSTYAADDWCSDRGALPGTPIPRGELSEVCLTPVFTTGLPSSLTLTRTCWPCGSVLSVCNAVLEERVTRDLPPGGEIRLDPRDYATGCLISCTDECIPGEIECEVPALTPGEYYRVWLGDEVVLDFTAGSDAPTCGDDD